MKNLVNFNTRIKESTKDLLNDYSENEGRTIQWIAETALEKFARKEVEKNDLIISVFEKSWERKLEIFKELYEYGKNKGFKDVEDTLNSIRIFESQIKFLNELKSFDIEELKSHLYNRG